MKSLLLLLPVPLLAACASNGWDALPTDDDVRCVQVTEWESDGFTTTTEALGTYCR